MDTELRVLIVDDEPLARAKLQTLLSRTTLPPARTIEAANGESALLAADASAVNLALIDVQMPGINGLSLARSLRERYSGLAIIFVTAFEGYALGAFEVEAVDYLTKPVAQPRLDEALERARRWLSRPSEIALGEHIAVRERGAVIRVPLDSVLCFKAEMKYTTLITSEREYVIDTPLSELEERHTDRFIRVHRSALVSIAAITSLSKEAMTDAEGGEVWVLHLRGLKEAIPVSRRQLTEVRSKLKQ
jgi:two-component system, LytTR family, response regulator AlgR